MTEIPALKSKVKPAGSLLFILLSFFILRFLVLWTGVERVSHYDELDLGTIAKEILQGLKFPYWDYQMDFYSGDSLILGAAVLPFFKLMGMNLMAIKMVPFVFSSLTLLLSFLFLRRYFGEKAGLMGAWLLVLCPQSFVQLSLVGMSGHSEALFWSTAGVFAFYEFMHGPSHSQIPALFLFGVLSGFGLWFYYANGMMTAACLLSWLILDRRSFFSRKLGIFAVCFLAGFSPWLIYNAQNLSPVFDFFTGLSNPAHGPGRRTLLDFLKKNARLFLFGLPNAFVFYRTFEIPERILSWGYYFLCFLPAAAGGICNSRNAKILPLALYVFAFCIVFGAVSYDLQPEFGFIGSRYLTPLLFWNLLLFAVLTDRLGKAGRYWRLAVLALGFVTQTGLMFREPGGSALHFKGYSYYQLGQRWAYSPVSPLLQVRDFSGLLRKFPEEERYFFLWGLSDAGIMNNESSILKGTFRAEDFFQKNTGVYFYEWYGNVTRASGIQEALEFSQRFPASERSYFLKGWLNAWPDILETANCPACFDAFDGDSRKWAARSFGKSMYPDGDFQSLSGEDRSWAWRGAAYPFFMNQITFAKRPVPEIMAGSFLKKADQNKADVVWGMGWTVGESFREDRARAQAWIQQLPVQDRPAALEGLRFFETWYRWPREI